MMAVLMDILLGLVPGLLFAGMSVFWAVYGPEGDFLDYSNLQRVAITGFLGLSLLVLGVLHLVNKYMV